jgi:hypothetical protein
MGDWWKERTRGQKVGIVVAAFVVIGIVGSEGSPNDSDQGVSAAATTSSTEPGTTTTEQPQTTSAPSTTTTRPTTTTREATTTTTTLPDGSFGDGILIVGEDVTPGVYMTDRDGCYWARLSSPSSSFDDINANGNVSGRVIVEILDSDVAFESSRCGQWIPYAPTPETATSFGDGVWAIGSDIDAGLYASSDVSGCYFARLSGFTGDFNDLTANANIDGRAVVDIRAEDIGFESSRCGTWTLVDTSVSVTAPAEFGNGIQLVGIHIAPGRYRLENASSCYYARLSGVSGGFGDIIANNNVAGTVTVDIAASDFAFESSRCGTWVPTG